MLSRAAGFSVSIKWKNLSSRIRLSWVQVELVLVWRPSMCLRLRTILIPNGAISNQWIEHKEFNSSKPWTVQPKLSRSYFFIPINKRPQAVSQNSTYPTFLPPDVHLLSPIPHPRNHSSLQIMDHYKLWTSLSQFAILNVYLNNLWTIQANLLFIPGEGLTDEERGTEGEDFKGKGM